MKKILISILFALSLNANAENTSLQEIKGIASYNATIIGYSIFCEYPKTEVELMKSQLVSVINQIGLNDKDYTEVQKSFMDTLEIAKIKGPSNSSMSCEQFKVEFDKIANAIKTGKSQ